MPRNEIAAIVGLVVAVAWFLAAPGLRRRTLPAATLLPALFVFCVAFLVAWIVLRLIGV